MVYHGDYATYERVKEAMSIMSNVDDNSFINLIPTFADFHLQMRWAKVMYIISLLWKLLRHFHALAQHIKIVHLASFYKHIVAIYVNLYRFDMFAGQMFLCVSIKEPRCSLWPWFSWKRQQREHQHLCSAVWQLNRASNFTCLLIFQAIMDRFFLCHELPWYHIFGSTEIVLQSKQVNCDTSKNYYAISLFLDKVLDGYLQCFAKTFIDSGDLSSAKGKCRFIFTSCTAIILVVSKAFLNWATTDFNE